MKDFRSPILSSRGGIFGDDVEGSLGSGRLAEAPFPHPEETRVSYHCDAPGCEAYRLSVNGRAVPHPSDPGRHIPADRATESWFALNGKDYCPAHGKAITSENVKEEAFGVSVASTPLLPGAVDVADEHEPDEPEIARSQENSLEIWASAPTAGLIAIIVLLLIGIVYLYERMSRDEGLLVLSTKSAFEEQGHIRFLDYNKIGNTLRCSGEILSQNSPPVPVRYTCDKDHCVFEGK